MSDLDTQLVAGADNISKFIDDPVTGSYLSENNAKRVSFQQYPKDCRTLVESCVKLTKRLLSGSVGRNVLGFRDLNILCVKQCIWYIDVRLRTVKVCVTVLPIVYRCRSLRNYLYAVITCL